MVMLEKLALKPVDLSGKISVGFHWLPQANKRLDNYDAHMDGPLAAQNTRKHHHPILGKHKGKLSSSTMPVHT